MSKGQKAFEAHRRALAYHTPEWLSLSQSERDAWEAVGEAFSDETSCACCGYWVDD